jgi:hypothetical protein
MALVVLLLLAACAFAAESDALAISARIQSTHMPFGIVVDPIFASPDSDQVIGYTRCGDSALWSAFNLAAESFRYSVTRSDDSLSNIRTALAGLQGLVDVTGSNLLARCAVPADSPYAAGIASEEKNNGVYEGFIANRSYYWIGNTSRDQYSGVFFGLSVTHDFVDDPDVKQSSAALVSQLLQELLRRNWILIFPNLDINAFQLRPDQQLALLEIGRSVDPDRFAQTYAEMAAAKHSSVIIPIAFDCIDQHSAYYKFNLNTINLYSLIRLETDPVNLAYYWPAYDMEWGILSKHENAHFNMIDRALKAADATRDSVTVTLLQQWLTRPRRDYWVDLNGLFLACGENRSCDVIPVPQRINSDFLWQRSPFQLSGGGIGTIETAAIDYILPYWMARYYEIPVD